MNAELIERLRTAVKIIGTMCAEGRPPKMSIPARPDVDEDFIIVRAMQSAITALSSPAPYGVDPAKMLKAAAVTAADAPAGVDVVLLADALRIVSQAAGPVALIKRNASGQIYMTDAAGSAFDLSRYVGASLYAAPQAAAVPDGSAVVVSKYNGGALAFGLLKFAESLELREASTPKQTMLDIQMLKKAAHTLCPLCSEAVPEQQTAPGYVCGQTREICGRGFDSAYLGNIDICTNKAPGGLTCGHPRACHDSGKGGAR